MPRNSPTLADTLRAALDARLSGLRVLLPGIVQSYDAGRQRADVQPAVRDGFWDESGARQAEDLPVVTEVPVVFPGAGGRALTFPLAPGDEVALVFSSSSLDRWLARGGVLDPEDDRRHALSDAVAIPGLRHAALPSSAVGAGMVLAADLVQVGSSGAVDGVFLSTQFLSDFSTLIGAVATAAAGTGGGVTSAINAALATFLGQASGYVSAKVKVE